MKTKINISMKISECLFNVYLTVDRQKHDFRANFLSLTTKNAVLKTKKDILHEEKIFN